MASNQQKIDIAVPLVTKLIKQQFPHWAHLTINPVQYGGWDNRTFRLGNTMSIRLPSAQCYAAKVAKEQEWLPRLAPHLTMPIPQPVALGKPSDDYPWHWSIYRWIEGERADKIVMNDAELEQLACDVAHFLKELQAIDTTGGLIPGPHNFYRGASPAVYDSETRSALEKLGNIVDTDACTRVWEKAIESQWDKAPVWFHGDLSAGNILVRDGKLAGVIDFGGVAVGDPACDLVIAWTFFKGKSREVFRSTVDMDKKTWDRARGWALWKALITLNELRAKESAITIEQKEIIDAVVRTSKNITIKIVKNH